MVSTWCLLLIISQVVSSLDCCCVWTWCAHGPHGKPLTHPEPSQALRKPSRCITFHFLFIGELVNQKDWSGECWPLCWGLRFLGLLALFEQAAALGAVCLWTPSGKSLPLPKQSSAACLTLLECSKSCDVMYSRLPRGVWMRCLHYLCYCSLLLVQIIKTCFLSPDSRSLDLSTGFMFMSAAVNSKSKAVGFSFKLFNSFIDKYLL